MYPRFSSSLMASLAIALAVLVVVSVAPTRSAEAVVSGGIHTTDVECNGVDLNLYNSKLDVYLEGGPGKVGASAITAGDYGVRVTAPGGNILGTNADGELVTVGDDGVFPCFRLWDLVEKESDGTQGYNDTTNNGGVYKVAICLEAAFDTSDCKYDAFKVELEPPPVDACTEHPGRTILQWSETLGSPSIAGLLQETSVAAVSIDAGTYNVTLQSYDDHAHKPGQVQDQEQWYAIFSNGGGVEDTSGEIADLPDDDDYINEMVGTVTFGDTVTEVVARHLVEFTGTPGENPQSIVPFCLALDPVEEVSASADSEESDPPGKGRPEGAGAQGKAHGLRGR